LLLSAFCASATVESLGIDADGELYIVDHDGRILKIVPAS
jgi:hypothetical protein